VSICDELRNAMQHWAPRDLPPTLRAHASRCPSCTARLESPLRRLSPTAAPAGIDPEALWRTMPEALASEERGFGRLRCLPTRWRISGGLIGLAALGLLIHECFGRADGFPLQDPWHWLGWAPNGTLAGICAWLILEPCHRLHHPFWTSSLLLMLALALGVLPVVVAEHPTSAEPTSAGHYVSGAVPCLGAGLLLGLSCFACVSPFIQRSRSFGRLPWGAWALMVCGASALLTLHCPQTARLHLTAGHASVGLVVVIAAYATRLRVAR
jgi:hypothetical protein